MKLSVYILASIGLALLNNDSFSQNKFEQTDTAIVYEILNAHILNIGKSKVQEIYFLNLSCKSSTENDKDKDINFPIEICPSSLQWNGSRIESRMTILKPSDSIRHGDNSYFISCPKFNKDRTRCKVYTRIHSGEWSSYSSYFYYKKVRGKWKFKKSALVSIS